MTVQTTSHPVWHSRAGAAPAVLADLFRQAAKLIETEGYSPCADGIFVRARRPGHSVTTSLDAAAAFACQDHPADAADLAEDAQPYAERAAYYRRPGRHEQARRVLRAKPRQLTRLRPPVARWWWLQDVLAGYGYAPGRALFLLAGAFIAGWLFFSAHHPVPAGPGPQPVFNAALYTLDVLIPVLTLGRPTTFIRRGLGLRWRPGYTSWAGCSRSP